MANDKSSLVQIAQATLDQANQSQKVTVVATTPGVQQEVDITDIAGAAPSATNPLPVRLTDGSGFYSANAGFILDGTNVTAEQDTEVPADNKGSPVVILPGQGLAPISPATEGTVSAINTKTPALVSGRVPVDGSGVTQPVSAASLPLPTGAATEATLAAVETAVDGLETTVATLATETTAAAILADTADIEIAVEAINTKTPALVSGAVPVISGLGVPAHDAISASFAATTDTYTYKTGGLSGTTVSTVVITYTDSTKAVLQSVVRS